MQFIKFEGKEGVFLEKEEATLISMLVGLAGLTVLPYPKQSKTIFRFLKLVQAFYESEKKPV